MPQHTRLRRPVRFPMSMQFERLIRPPADESSRTCPVTWRSRSRYAARITRISLPPPEFVRAPPGSHVPSEAGDEGRRGAVEGQSHVLAVHAVEGDPVIRSGRPGSMLPVGEPGAPPADDVRLVEARGRERAVVLELNCRPAPVRPHARQLISGVDRDWVVAGTGGQQECHRTSQRSARECTSYPLMLVGSHTAPPLVSRTCPVATPQGSDGHHLERVQVLVSMGPGATLRHSLPRCHPVCRRPWKGGRTGCGASGSAFGARHTRTTPRGGAAAGPAAARDLRRSRALAADQAGRREGGRREEVEETGYVFTTRAGQPAVEGTAWSFLTVPVDVRCRSVSYTRCV